MKKESKELKKARAGYWRSLLLLLGLSGFYILVPILLPTPPADGGFEAIKAFVDTTEFSMRNQLLGFRVGAAVAGVFLCIALGGYYIWLLCSPKRCLEEFRKNYDERQQRVREKAGYLAMITSMVLLTTAVLIVTTFSWFLSVILVCVLYMQIIVYGLFYLFYKLKS